jgi:hypothetical protein
MDAVVDESIISRNCIFSATNWIACIPRRIRFFTVWWPGVHIGNPSLSPYFCITVSYDNMSTTTHPPPDNIYRTFFAIFCSRDCILNVIFIGVFPRQTRCDILILEIPVSPVILNITYCSTPTGTPTGAITSTTSAAVWWSTMDIVC